MNSDEHKKSGEELTEEALDAVAGGQGRTPQAAMCPTCQKRVLRVLAELRDGHYYCPDCHTPLPLEKKELRQ